MEKIDFTTPCLPNIHAMPEEVQRAGDIIRREIHRLHGRMRSEARRHDDRSAASTYRSAGAEGEARRAVGCLGERHHRLSEAYHAWACTAQRAKPFEADPALLAAVYAADA